MTLLRSVDPEGVKRRRQHRLEGRVYLNKVHLYYKYQSLIIT